MLSFRRNAHTLATLALAITVGCLLFANSELLHQNAALNARIDSIQSLQGPRIGSRVGHLSGVDLNGKPLVVTFDATSEKTLLLVFSPYCRYCKNNWPEWQKLLHAQKAAHVVYADLSGKATMSYIDTYDYTDHKQVIRLDQETKNAYSLSSTPMTLIIGPRGNVDGVWIGALSGNQTNAIIGQL